MQNYQACLKEKKVLTKNVFRFQFELLKPKEINFLPGQYLLLDIKEGYRQYSISSPPSQMHYVETIVDLSPMGEGSKYLLNLKLGGTVSFRAPMGQFILRENSLPKFFLATGAGISPLKAMIQHLLEKNASEPLTLLWGLPKENNLYLDLFWQSLAKKNANFQYYYCFSQQNFKKPHSFCGHIQNKLSETNISKNSQFYLCGRPEVVESLQKHLCHTLGVAKENVFYEKYS
jgi:NAD(P)H-flavin reductase